MHSLLVLGKESEIRKRIEKSDFKTKSNNHKIQTDSKYFYPNKSELNRKSNNICGNPK